MPTIRVLVDERCDRLVANRSVFGSALNHHVHLHACLTNGVFVPAADDAERDAPPARPINQADLAALGVWLVFSRENVPDPFRPKGGQKGQAPFADTNGASPCRGRESRRVVRAQRAAEPGRWRRYAKSIASLTRDAT